jgi:hypothetical protein
MKEVCLRPENQGVQKQKRLGPEIELSCHRVVVVVVVRYVKFTLFLDLGTRRR